MSKSKASITFSGIRARIKIFLGCVYFIGGIVMGILIFLSEDYLGTKDPSFIYLPFLMTLVGIFLIRLGSKTNNRIKRFAKYVDLISNEQMTSLQDIATTTNQSVDFVIKDFQTMIEKKYFESAWLDLNKGEVIMGHKFQNEGAHARVQVQSQVSQSMKAVVQCSGCGAKNSVEVGQVKKCEFCDTPLSA